MVAINRKGYTAGEQITKRLNALGEFQASSCFGISRWFILILFLTGGAWAISAMQTLIFAYLLRAIKEDFPMDTSQKAFVNGSVMTGAFLGSFIFGNLADMYGRKQMLLASFSLGTVGCALCAVSPSIEVLSLFRFIAGIGLGGEQPIMGSLILELSPERVRGRMLVYMDAFWAIGSIVALVLAYEVEPHIGWRYVSAVNAGLLSYAALIHLYIPESPKWLATVGRYDDAARVMRTIESHCGILLAAEADDIILNGGTSAYSPTLLRQLTAGVDSTTVDLAASQMIVQSNKQSFFRLLIDRFRVLFRYPYFSRTMVLWVVCTGMSLTYYGVDIYFLDHLTDRVASVSGRNLVIYGAAVAQIPGYLLAARLVERLGRRNTLTLFLIGACVGSLVEAYVTPTTTALFLSGCFRSFFFMGAWGALYAYVPEHYPITIRVMGSAYAWGISRIGAFLGPYLVIWMSEQWAFSIPQVVWSLCAVLFVVIIVLFFFGVETAGQQIDETERLRISKSKTAWAVRESLRDYLILEDPYYRCFSVQFASDFEPNALFLRKIETNMDISSPSLVLPSASQPNVAAASTTSPDAAAPWVYNDSATAPTAPWIFYADVSSSLPLAIAARVSSSSSPDTSDAAVVLRFHFEFATGYHSGAAQSNPNTLTLDVRVEEDSDSARDGRRISVRKSRFLPLVAAVGNASSAYGHLYFNLSNEQLKRYRPWRLYASLLLLRASASSSSSTPVTHDVSWLLEQCLEGRHGSSEDNSWTYSALLQFLDGLLCASSAQCPVEISAAVAVGTNGTTTVDSAEAGEPSQSLVLRYTPMEQTLTLSRVDFASTLEFLVATEEDASGGGGATTGVRTRIIPNLTHDENSLSALSEMLMELYNGQQSASTTNTNNGTTPLVKVFRGASTTTSSINSASGSEEVIRIQYFFLPTWTSYSGSGVSSSELLPYVQTVLGDPPIVKTVRSSERLELAVLDS